MRLPLQTGKIDKKDHLPRVKPKHTFNDIRIAAPRTVRNTYLNEEIFINVIYWGSIIAQQRKNWWKDFNNENADKIGMGNCISFFNKAAVTADSVPRGENSKQSSYLWENIF